MNGSNLFILLFIIAACVCLIIYDKNNKKKLSLEHNIYTVGQNEFKNTRVPSGRYFINLKKNKLMRCENLTTYYIIDQLGFAFIGVMFDLDADGDFIYIQSDQNERIKKIYNC